MVKPETIPEDHESLSELGAQDKPETLRDHTPKQERVIAGFTDVTQFVEQHGYLPKRGAQTDIFERIYAVRLETIRASKKQRDLLQSHDGKGLLDAVDNDDPDDMDDAALLAELGVDIDRKDDITTLTHVKPRAEINAAEDIAKRIPCKDFDQFKPLFIKIREDLAFKLRKARRFKENAKIKQGEFFILGGQIAYVATVGKEIKTSQGATDARLRVIYDNGSESDLLLRSLQRALYKDTHGRRITELSDGPLFSDTPETGDIESGTIYVLRSESNHPYVVANRTLVHKIGVTGGDVKKRIANAKDDPTFMLADVKVVATYKLSNINRARLEKLIHKFFEAEQIDIEIKDRFNKPTRPREWFFVPRFIIDELVEKIRAGQIVRFRYDASQGKIVDIKAQK